MITSCEKAGKYTEINPMSSFGLIEEDMELSHESHIHLAVYCIDTDSTYFTNK